MVLGTDAPTLTGDHLTAAFAALEGGSDVVLGPAFDGGYYLIGMRAPHTGLFGIDPALWSTEKVLTATLALAERKRLSTQLLSPLRDLDTPDDAAALLDDPRLPADIAALLRKERPVKVSIIMPVLNEEATVRTSLSRLCRDFPDCELVVDGGSTDATVESASPHATVLHSARGRARQMNTGARHCTGEVLWFVHADTEIAPAALAQIRAVLAAPDVVGGAV